MECWSEFSLLVESDQTVTAGPQQEEKLTGITALIELITDSIVIVASLFLQLAPHHLVASKQSPRIVLDQTPDADEWSTGITTTNPPDSDVAVKKLLQDRAATDEWLVIGRDLGRELLYYLRSLKTLATSPFDEDPIAFGLVKSVGNFIP